MIPIEPALASPKGRNKSTLEPKGAAHEGLTQAPSAPAKTNGQVTSKNADPAPRLIPIQCHVDDRGFLCQIFGNYAELFPIVARAYVVGNFAKGTIRGFHMHKHETKAYFVINGSAKFVVVDEDKNSKSFTLSSRKAGVLVVPPKNYHGWISLEEGTILVGLSDASLEQSVTDDYRVDPMSFGKELWTVMAR